MPTMELIEQDELLEQEDWFDEDEPLDEEKVLKNCLIDRIECLHGAERLYELILHIDEQFPDCGYELTPEEQRSIDEGLAQADAGLCISDEEARRRINKCLERLAKDYP